MNILVTGAGGFLGSYIVDHYIRNGDNVWGTYRAGILHKHDGCNYIKIDLREEINKLFTEEYDCVIHCAGQVLDAGTWDYIDNSVIMTKRLIDECEKYNINNFIFMSSIAVYGECDGNVNELSGHKNLNDYAIAKLLCERILEQSKIGYKYVIRLSRIIGLGGFNTGGFLTSFIKRLINNEPLNYSNPQMLFNNIFDASDIGNICDVLINMRNPFFLVGVGASQPMTIEELVNYIKKETKSESEIRVIRNCEKVSTHLIDTARLNQIFNNNKTVKDCLDVLVIAGKREFKRGCLNE